MGCMAHFGACQASEADFFSVRINDLIQRTMSAVRTKARVTPSVSLSAQFVPGLKRAI